MSKMKKLILVIACLLILPSIVNACSCIAWQGTDKAYDQAAYVFSGKVIDIARPVVMVSTADEVKYTFEVYNVWKGENKAQIEVYSALDSVSCGYEFKLDEEYLVYTYESENKLLTGICNYPKLLSEATDEVNELNEISTPSDDVPKENNSIWKNSNLVIYAIVFILALVFVKKLCTDK